MERDRDRPSHRVESGHCPTEPWVLNISMQPASQELLVEALSINAVGRAGSPSRTVPGCQLGSRRAARRSAPTTRPSNQLKVPFPQQMAQAKVKCSEREQRIASACVG